MATMASLYLQSVTSSSCSTHFTQQHHHHSRHGSIGYTPTTLFLSPPRQPPSSRSFVGGPTRAFPASVVGDTLVRDAGATVLVMSGGYAVVSAFDNLAQHGTIPQSLSRKLVHILSGLLFMASWPLFSTSPEARYFASIVPLANCLRLLIVGLSASNNEALLKSLTREGKPEELLRGPLYYVLVLTLCAVVFWRESPIGVISVSMMCGGDGIADIMGRKFGHVKLPYNPDKSWAGSMSMFAFGFLISIGMLYYFTAFGYFKLDWVLAMKRVALVSLVATAIESFPITKLVDDNIAVPVATIAAAYMCFCM